jgi:hypothetical protein
LDDHVSRPGTSGRSRVFWLIGAVALLLAVIIFAARWQARPSARTTRNGGVILGWHRAPSAHSYLVRFLAPTGATIDSIEGVETLELVLTREALPRHLLPGSMVRWTVSAFRAGREIGKSAPQALRLP